MPNRPYCVRSLRALAVLALAGCATTVGGDPAAVPGDDAAAVVGDDPAVVEVEVQNNLLPSTDAEVYVRWNGDEPRLLGTAPGGESTRLRVRSESATRPVRLVARVDDRELVSDPLVAADARRVSWNLMTNVISTIDPAPDPG